MGRKRSWVPEPFCPRFGYFFQHGGVLLSPLACMETVASVKAHTKYSYRFPHLVCPFAFNMDTSRELP